ncbi:MAG: ABC transporter ATP-binding protein [Cyanobium sp.]
MTHAASPPAIEIDLLTFSYPDGTPALTGINLSVSRHESVAVVGANGAGKSTLLALLTGLLDPLSGSIRIGGIPLERRSLAEIRRFLGMVFQDSDDQLFMPTAAEDVAFGPRNLGLPAEQVERRVSQALERVGASSLRERSPHRLSGGEKRAVAIATVLAMEPAVLLLDEPSSNLDPRARRRLIRLLQGLAHTRVVATHDLDLALDLCERTVVMQAGRVVADGPTGRIFADAALLERCGLEPPLAMQPCPTCSRR